MGIEISLGEHLETVLNGDPLRAKQTVDNRRLNHWPSGRDFECWPTQH